ncbi:MAG: peptidylprolyl isomerase [Thermotogota bacterium]
MNKWFVKHEKFISILIVSLFVIGIIWWSIGSYLSTNNGNGRTQNEEFIKENSVVVITKDGEDLDYPYWVMESELSNEYQNRIQQYEQHYGNSIDPVFDSLNIKASLTNQLYDLKLIMYYSDNNDLTPTKDQVEERTNLEIENYISELKSNQSNWAQLIDRYGSENEIRDVLNESMAGIETQVMIDNVRENVVSVNREDVLEEIEKTFDDIKKEHEEVNAQHILISGEATANRVKDELVSGELDFSDAAATFSEDTSNATDSGNLGWFSHGDMVEEFENAAFTAPVGEIVGPVETQFGYHLIRVQDKKVFDKPEDVLEYETIYKEIENTLEENEFDEWLANYKEEENFGRNYYNDVLEYAYTFNNNTDDINTLENIRTELQDFVFYNDGEVSIDTDTDYMALYINTTKALLNDYESKLSSVTKYISLNDKVEDTYMEMDLEELKNDLAEIDEKLESEDSENQDSLIEEKLAITDAINYKETLPVIDEMGIDTIEEAQTEKDNLESLVEEISSNREQVLEELFYRYPSSQRVVESYYEANPNDPRVKIAYAKVQMKQLEQYAGYLGAQNLSMYFSQQIRDIVINISSIVSNNSERNIKLDAIEVGLDLAELLEDEELELSYLKELEKIDPEYINNLESRIEELENKINGNSEVEEPIEEFDEEFEGDFEGNNDMGDLDSLEDPTEE